MTQPLHEHLGEVISSTTGEPFRCRESRPAGGGCINQAVILDGGARRYFVKLNRREAADMFQAEARGLAVLGDTDTVRVPRPIQCGRHGQHAYLILEYLRLEPLGSRAASKLGERLAELHRHGADRFGWERDNTIGSTPQHNAWDASWPRFWQQRRLGALAGWLEGRLAAGELDALQGLIETVPALLEGHAPSPSLLHGDLWGGNASQTAHGEPVVYDPAVYFGDREADLAMTELFGGFDPAFREAYTATWPPDPGYATRRDLYNLYHVLNHALLFGGGYRARAVDMTRRLLAAAGV